MSAPSRQPNASREPLGTLFAASDGTKKSLGVQRNGFIAERLNAEHNQATHPVLSPAKFGNPSLSALSIPDGYVITEHDRERMLRTLARNATSPSFIARPSSTPISPPTYHPTSNIPAKRSLDPSAQQYASSEGRPPKRGLFAPPVVQSQRSASEGIVTPIQNTKHIAKSGDRRLSMEAAKRGVGRLDFSTASFHGIDKSPDVGDVPEPGQADTTPSYARKLQETRKRGESGRSTRRDSVVGGGGAEMNRLAATAAGIVHPANLGSAEQDLHKQQQMQMQEKFLRMKHGAGQKRGAVNRGVTMREVEVNDGNKKMADASCSFRVRYGHLHCFEEAFASEVRGVGKPVPARAEVVDWDGEMFVAQGALEKGRVGSHEVISLEHDRAVPGPPPAQALEVCEKDQDGTYRAPERQGACEQKAELLWSLKLLNDQKGSEWARDDAGEWYHLEAGRETDLIELHRWAAFS